MAGMVRYMNELRPPKPVICEARQPVFGLHLIVPVKLEGYHKGYNSMVQDIYEHACLYSKDKGPRYYWRWARRIRSHSKPTHYSMKHRCTECEKWHKIFPTRDDDVLMER